MKPEIYFRAGLDIGSTTAKLAIINAAGHLVFSKYIRHNTRIIESTIDIFKALTAIEGDLTIALRVTGSAGIGISERANIPFVQEVIASTTVIKEQFPEVKTLIDIGGEDSKMIFFNKNKPPDIRMNGNCAGGTGAFIDQMATLLNIAPAQLNDFAAKHTHIYPIASRCGVFAKTDVQNLISSKISNNDIAASIFHAVVVQALNTLARGYDIEPKIMFAGGPFTFLAELKNIFISDLDIKESDAITPEHPELLPAIGAAIANDEPVLQIKISELIERLKTSQSYNSKFNTRLSPLFKRRADFDKWTNSSVNHVVTQTELIDYQNNDCFIGIDSGSTTTKIAVTGSNNELLFSYYNNNEGNPVETVTKGLSLFVKELKKTGKNITVKRTVVTGYGEDLIKAAFGCDIGIVETIAHFTAAKHFNPDVSFILDIGGQDMKAIFIENGIIKRIELNESCSSGCGSFIETFGKTLGHNVGDFAKLACNSQAPCDLGTRCTVFMNSKVKQALRENAEIADISAGLAISVIKNALFKVLKLTGYDELGDNIVVQGGTFRNPAILRAFEMLTGKNIVCSNIPELMGAYGAALLAKETKSNKIKSSFTHLDKLTELTNYTTTQNRCKGCENNCTITKFTFSNNNSYYSGNKCEKIFTNRGEELRKGENIFEYKLQLLFERKNQAKTNGIKIGIPRVLNLFDNYPFWHTLLINCGFGVELSSQSTMKIYEQGSGTVMSDSICFPAKLVHGHIKNLVTKKCDRIFYPFVVYEKKEFDDADNTFNCPIVSSYSDVIKSSINTESKHNIPLDAPTISFSDNDLLYKACKKYLTGLGVKTGVIKKAFQQAVNEQQNYKNAIIKRGKEIINNAENENRFVIVLAGRPYHADSLINHKIPQILKDMGVDVITEDAIPYTKNISTNEVITQWSYPNRIYNAATWVGRMPDNFQFVQLNSFGCGPDAIVIDESAEILRLYGKNHTLIRIDEITSTGSVRLRLRSLIESLKLKETSKNFKPLERLSTAVFTEKEKQRVILAPFFAEMYSPLLPAIFELGGYKLINLPPPNKESVQFGLKYSNNEICYPATIIVGDVIKALKSGRYNLDEVAIGITQTGGQCRASSYMALIKKAMINARLGHVPLISVNAGNTNNHQPGFNIEWSKIITETLVSILFADALAKVYYATIVRAKNKQKVKELLTLYHNKVHKYIVNKDIKGIFLLLESAIDDFNTVEKNDKEYPKMGLVGEIYVKYNSFGHQNIIDWLIEQEVEVVLPPFLDFFIQELVNIETNARNYLNKIGMKTNIFLFLIEKKANYYVRKTNKILKRFALSEPISNIRDIASKASKILQLANQFGEGWLIPAEIAEFAENGINNVVSVQPFGCIANHVVSKGVEKRIKDLYPDINLLFLDFDDGTSPVNIINRLHFIVKNVKEYIYK